MSEPRKMRVGVLGAGQLALMLAEAAAGIGVDVICAGQPGDCAGQVARVETVDLNNAKAVAEFAAQVDVVTVESENLEMDVLGGLALHPNARAVGVAQDRLIEKRFFEACGVAVAPFAPVNSLEDLERAIKAIGLPAILKTVRGRRGCMRWRTRRQRGSLWAVCRAACRASWRGCCSSIPRCR